MGIRFLLGAALLVMAVLPRAVEAAPVLNPDNGPYYDAIARNSGIGWDAANAVAQLLPVPGAGWAESHPRSQLRGSRLLGKKVIPMR